MTIREFYKSHYDLELTRKTDITAALAVPIGILSVLLGGLIVMAKELHVPLSSAEEILAIGILLSALALSVSAYFLIRSLFNFSYGYIATPLEILKYQEGLVAFHEGAGMSTPDAKELAEEETLDYIGAEYAKYADRNSKNNDIKSTYLHRANGAMIAAVVCGGAAGAVYVYNSMKVAAPVPKVEVINLKEAMPMIPNPSIQAATTPPPPPPVRPTAPPGRIVREHQVPPRPPTPSSTVNLTDK